MECGDTPPWRRSKYLQSPWQLGRTNSAGAQSVHNHPIIGRVRQHEGNWNSGTFLSCFVLGAGVGIGVASYTGNPRLGALASSMVAAGCSRAVQYSTEDGDQYIC